MKLDRKGIGSATILIVLAAATFGTIGPPVLADAVNTQADSPFYSLEIVGEHIKQPFSDKTDMNLALAEERFDEFTHMVNNGKADKYSWLVEEANANFTQAITSSGDTSELNLALQEFREYSLKLENVEANVPKEVEVELKALQLQSFRKVNEVENMMRGKKFSEIKVVELGSRLREIEVDTRELVEKEGSDLEFELSGNSEEMTLRTKDSSFALQIGKIQENPQIRRIENLTVEIEKSGAENYYFEIGPSENISVVWPEDNIRIELGLDNIEVRLPSELAPADNFVVDNIDNVGDIDFEVTDNIVEIDNIEEKSPQFADGSGTEEDPYQITDVEQLQAMGKDLHAHYVLINDINASETVNWNDGKGFKPVGTGGNRFMGSFDGQGYVIKKLYINRPEENTVGLFGFVNSSAEIRSVGLEDITVTGDVDVGGLVGVNLGSVSDSYSTGIVTGDNTVGGLVGWNTESVSWSYSTCSASGDWYVGGLVGQNSGSVSESYSTGVTSGDSYVGGLVGSNMESVSKSFSKNSVTASGSHVGGLAGFSLGTVSGSYSSCTVTGEGAVGGLVGSNWNSVSDSYATGAVTGDYNVGGLAGLNVKSVSGSYSTGTVAGENNIGGLVGSNPGSVSNSFYDTETSGQSDTGKGEPKTTEEMMDINTFTNAGWDIALLEDYVDETWYIDDGNDYPHLGWEKLYIKQIENVIIILENNWVWTDKNWYTSGENVKIYFQNKEEENLVYPGGYTYPPSWHIERHENGVWEKVKIFPPDRAWLMLLPPPLEPGEMTSFTWNQIVYEGIRENYTASFAELGKYRVVWEPEDVETGESIGKFISEFRILPKSFEILENVEIIVENTLGDNVVLGPIENLEVHLENENDIDKDGIPDWYELQEVDQWRADPHHGDMFVEIDRMEDSNWFVPSVKQELRRVFENSPIINPDGTPGVKLHLVESDVLPSVDEFDSSMLTEYIENYKDHGRGFYYCLLLGDSVGYGATAVVGAQGFYFYPSAGLDKNYSEISSTFMHELGHCLGLFEVFDGIDSHKYSFSEYRSVTNYSSPNEFYNYSSEPPFDDWEYLEDEGFFFPTFREDIGIENIHVEK